MSEKSICINSEIGKLKTAILHRPGKEVENIIPELKDRLLFEDIPYLEVAQQEHDAFANLLRSNDVEVLYLENLVAEVLESEVIKQSFINEFILEANVRGRDKKAIVKEYFDSIKSTNELVDKMMEGIRRDEIGEYPMRSLADMVFEDYPFLIDPMPNLYFARDPFSVVGKGVSLNSMRVENRRRETIFSKYIIKYHPAFSSQEIPVWYSKDDEFCLEGGDIIVLGEKVIAIGISQRTDAEAIEKFARKIFDDESNLFNVILAFDIPKSRAYMHLDSVFTMLDRDKFTLHPGITGPMCIYAIKPNQVDGGITIEKEYMEIEKVLEKYLEIEKATIIKCGGKAGVDAVREQWNDGANTLALSPGKVIVYSRNHVTNKMLEENGITPLAIPSSELSRGRGGPRCMTMPLLRDPI